MNQLSENLIFYIILLFLEILSVLYIFLKFLNLYITKLIKDADLYILYIYFFH